jgi:hypothetical protein
MINVVLCFVACFFYPYFGQERVLFSFLNKLAKYIIIALVVFFTTIVGCSKEEDSISIDCKEYVFEITFDTN